MAVQLAQDGFARWPRLIFASTIKSLRRRDWISGRIRFAIASPARSPLFVRPRIRNPRTILSPPRRPASCLAPTRPTCLSTAPGGQRAHAVARRARRSGGPVRQQPVCAMARHSRRRGRHAGHAVLTKIVGNPMLPAIHGGMTGAFLETSAIVGVMRELGISTLPKPIGLTINYLRSGRALDSYRQCLDRQTGPARRRF